MSDIVAWVGDWHGPGRVMWAHYMEYPHIPPTWAFTTEVARGRAARVPVKPESHTHVGGWEVRGLTQDEYDMLMLETLARAMLGEEP